MRGCVATDMVQSVDELREMVAIRSPSLQFDIMDYVETPQTGNPGHQRQPEDVSGWYVCGNCRHKPSAAEQVPRLPELFRGYDALGLPISRRNEAFAIIRKNGMYKHNVEMMKSTECELLREREQGKPKDLVVCGTYHGCYDRAYMWHQRCIATLPKTLFPRPPSQYL